MTITSLVTKPYVEQRQHGYYLTGSRVSLDSIVYAFQGGESPQEIVQSFPTLTLEQVYGAITFYLANEEVITLYLEAAEETFQSTAVSLREQNKEFLKKIAQAKQIGT